MMNESKPKRKSIKIMAATWRWGKRFAFWFVLFAIIAVLVYIQRANASGKRAIAAFEQKLKDRGITAFVKPQIPDNENGAPIYLAAMQMIKPLPKEFKEQTPYAYVGLAGWPKFGEGFSTQQVEHLKKIVPMNQHVYDLVDQAQQYPQCYFGWNMQDDYVGVLKSMARSRWCCRWLGLKVLYHQAENQNELAVKTILKIMQFAHDQSSESSAMVDMVSISEQALAIEALAGMLSRKELSVSQLQRLHNMIIKIRDELDVSSLLAKDINVLFFRAKTIQQDYDLVKADEQKSARYFEKQFPNGRKIYRTRWDWWLSTYLRQATHWCPGYSQKGIMPSLDFMLRVYDVTTVDQLKIEPKPQLIGGSQAQSNALAQTAYARDTLKLRGRLTSQTVALRCEQYRLEHGQWPNALTDIYKTVPVDEWGQPIHIHREKNGLRVYSIGFDGIDQKGIDRMKYYKIKEEIRQNLENQHSGNESGLADMLSDLPTIPLDKETDDWGTRLLDPDKRNQEPQNKGLQ